MSDELRGIWKVLEELKRDFKHFDDKWETQIQATARDGQKLSQLCTQVNNVEQLLTRGNGQKSVMVQLEGLHTEVTALQDAKGLEAKSVEETQVEARRARWIALAKWAAVAALVIPGLLALFGLGG